MNPLNKPKAAAPKSFKVCIHLMVLSPQGHITSQGDPTLKSGNPNAPEGVTRWSLACGHNVPFTPHCGHAATGDAKAVTCEKCLATLDFSDEAVKQYPREVENLKYDDVSDV